MAINVTTSKRLLLAFANQVNDFISTTKGSEGARGIDSAF